MDSNMSCDVPSADIIALQDDATRNKSAIIIAQYKVASATACRFMKWLSATKNIQVQDEWKEFLVFNDDELDRIGSRLEIQFGKYKGRTYYEVWSTDEGRRYLEWAVKQDWLYDEPAAIIKSLIKMSSPPAAQSSKKIKNANKKNKKKAAGDKKPQTKKQSKSKKRKSTTPPPTEAETVTETTHEILSQSEEDDFDIPTISKAPPPAKASRPTPAARKRTKVKISSI